MNVNNNRSNRPYENNNRINDMNSVAKVGGRGTISPSDVASQKQLSLGAPPAKRPFGGHYLTRGGVQVTANVIPLDFTLDAKNEGGSAFAIERIVKKLDDHRGVLLNSSYEFPGRYVLTT